MQENGRKIKNYSAMVLIGAMVFCMSQNLTGSVLYEIMDDYDIGLDKGGLMTFFQFVGGIIIILVLLKIADHMKKPILLMLGFAAAGVMLILIGGFQPFALFIVLYFVFGASLGTIDTLNNAVISDINPNNTDGILCILHGMCGIGATIIPLVTAVMGTANWKTTYQLVGVVALVIAILQMILYLKGKKDIDIYYQKTPKAMVKESAKGFFRDRDIWFTVLSILFFGLSQGSVTAWIVKFCKETFGEVGSLQWAICLSVYWLGTTICRLLMGTSASFKKLDSRRVIVIGGLLAGVAMIAGMIPHNYICFVLGVFLYGALSGATVPRAVGLMTNKYKQNTGLCSSVSYIAFYTGLGVAAIGMGVIAATWGIQVIMVMPAVTVILSGIAALPISKNE